MIISAYIAGTNGYSNGIVPMLRAYDATARYVDQGGNKRPGAFAIYLEPWHADIFDFIDLRKNHGKEEGRARKTIKAQELWYAILSAQVETGGPFMVYKDACNGMFDPLYNLLLVVHCGIAKSNQKNLGTIKS